MKKDKYLVFIIFLFFYNYSFSQTFTGKIIDNKNKIVDDAIVEVINNIKNTKFLSNENGIFQINTKIIKQDTLHLLIFKNGYKELKVKVNKNDEKIKLLIITKDTITHLEEVIITASNIINKSNKTIHIVNAKNYSKNAKVNVAIKTLPNISITEKGVIIDNQKKALIFIDGVESNIDEIKRINIKNIKKIEVITNPSASYGTAFLGGVINIISKKNNEKYYKGELETFAGVRLKSFGVVPSFSFKTKNLIFSSFYSRSNNNQSVNTTTNRVYDGSVFNQESNRDVTGWQDYISAKLKILLTPKASLYLRGNVSRYNLQSNTIGYYNLNYVNNNFNIKSLEKLKKGFLSTIYQYDLNKTENISAKYKYFDYTVNNYQNYFENSTNTINDVLSNIREHSIELTYNKQKCKIFNKSFDYTIGGKNIIRDFSFNNSSLNLKQNIYSFFVNTDIIFTNKFSIFSSILFDISKNKGELLNQKYNYILPTLSGIYKMNNTSNLKINYSRKITRPNPENLNPVDLYINPSYTLRGNQKLKPQTRDFYEIRFYNRFKNNNSFSINSYFENIKDGIIKSIINENNIFINTYENIGSINSYGINIGLNGKFLNKISVNLNNGIKYSLFQSNKNTSIIKENKGFSFNSSIFLYTLLKNNLSLSFTGTYNSPYYSLTSKTSKKPALSFDAEKSFFNDKVTLRLTYFDMFGLSTKTINEINYSNYSQYNTIHNKMTNLTMTIVYNFGKSFSTRYNDPVINNKDLKLK
ncbi:TonB-dependent receptor plug domain-containing protein [Tenacibaculum dicentrarchi]|uniref:TonB-dependent receptor plug domain-containing protein n=1 Tax=Tenacibaculum dicentrarchi TaxID=669041 RepID=UPI000C7A03E2|nr:conserved hypothetical protein [Tenacibaculum dicentrarchi]